MWIQFLDCNLIDDELLLVESSRSSIFWETPWTKTSRMIMGSSFFGPGRVMTLLKLDLGVDPVFNIVI